MKFTHFTASAAVVLAFGAAKADTLAVDLVPFSAFFSTIATATSVNTTLGLQPLSVTNLSTVSSFIAYCAEPFQLLSPAVLGAGDNTYTSSGAVSPAIQTLYNGYYANSLSSVNEFAAFQLALWELTADTGANLAAGAGFSVVNPLLPQVVRGQQMLANFLPASNLYTLTYWASPGSQDMIQATPVPEPATYGLMLLGLAAVGAVAARRKA